MLFSKRPVACTVSFLSDGTPHKSEVWIKRQGEDDGFEERKRFAELEAALVWTGTSLRKQVGAWGEDRRQFEQLKKTVSPQDKVLYFITDQSQLPEPERMRRHRTVAIEVRTRLTGGHSFRFICRY